MSKRIKVMLKKGHPHADEIGYINANENGGFDVTYSYEGAPPMMKVDLENCPHKAKGCYAMQKDCILLAVEE